MSQPKWKLVAQLGDAHPIDYGGYFIYVDETGVYPPEAEFLTAPESDNQPESEGPWTVHRFILEPCTYINGVLSDNKFHPDQPAWFAKPESERDSRPQDATYLKNVADFSGQPDLMTFIHSFTGDDLVAKAWAWRAVGEYHGFDNLDQYPLTLTRAEVEVRYAEELLANKQTKETK